MGVTLQIPFEQILSIVKQLTPEEKNQLKKELTIESKAPKVKNTRLTELLLSGPVFSEEQIGTIEENRKDINKWRKRD